MSQLLSLENRGSTSADRAELFEGRRNCARRVDRSARARWLNWESLYGRPRGAAME